MTLPIAVLRDDRTASDEAADVAACLVVTLGGPNGNETLGPSCKSVGVEECVGIMVYVGDLGRWRVQRWTVVVGDSLNVTIPAGDACVVHTLNHK